ncbi:MAG: TM2 domain-containing protein [Prevotellaceae bacterium]|nr:TM2 domain-containing protein [Candidatus Minthosoma caballi]
MKNKTTAGILAILLGGIGVHRFYMGHTVPGIVYLLLFWTGIPSILALIEGIMYLMDTDEKFQERVDAKKFISIM